MPQRYNSGRILPALILAFSLTCADGAAAESEMEHRAEIAELAQKNFLAGNFAGLEKTARKYREDKSRSPSGLWNLSLFYAGLDGLAEESAKDREGRPSFEALEERYRQWVLEFPESPTGHIVHGTALIERAWAYRGGGYASSVTEEGWEKFRQYIALARASLEKSKPYASVDPKWYESMLIVARAQNWERDAFDALVNEALEREPLFYQNYFHALQYLLPKWHGSLQEMEKFAWDAVQRTEQMEGMGIYARIYWYASQTHFKNDVFNNSLVDWPRMKQGFEDVISRYPDAWNLNNYAMFACMARDKAKTRELLRRIQSSIVEEAWVPPLLLGDCANWAHQP